MASTLCCRQRMKGVNGMKLLDLHINGFGKFHNRSVTFEEGINVVYGKNEAGKSTLHTFIRGMLFGIEKTRGRASKNDLYSKYEPWENSGTYEGKLRLEADGMIYRIERSFQKNKKEFTIINETLGKEVEPTKIFFDQILGGLSETAYNNTISISQLKSATDGGMISELKNYIANLNTSGNMALNITKATSFLKNQRKNLEVQMVAEAARSYTALLSEIRNIEKEISAPEYENQLHTYQKMRVEVKEVIEEKQQEKESLLQKIARGQQILAGSAFTDQVSITSYLTEAQGIYEKYQQEDIICKKKSNKALFVLSLILATLLLAGSGGLYYCYLKMIVLPIPLDSLLACGITLGGAALLYAASVLLNLRSNRHQRNLNLYIKGLQEIFSKHLGDVSISQEAMNAFQERMAEFTRLSAAVSKSEGAVKQLADEITSFQERQNTCNEVIEKQQRVQWELEHKLEHLSECKDKAEALKHVLSENEHLREEIAAIDLALETMTGLSTSIRDSFGLYLNKAASGLIDGITGGIYNSMSVDENLNIFLNTKAKLVPLEQVSSGTMDQVYLALRLATAKLIQTHAAQPSQTDRLPLVFDDSFVLYDDDRLKTALKWLSGAYQGQIIIFTCHQREAQMLTANLIPYHLISM